jgi:hypothetical protein
MTWTAPARVCKSCFSSKKERKNILSVEINYSNTVFGSYELGECLDSSSQSKSGLRILSR